MLTNQCPNCWGGSRLADNKLQPRRDPLCRKHLPPEPYEVWVSHDRHVLACHMRFNARFTFQYRALQEADWYHERGYRVEVRLSEPERR